MGVQVHTGSTIQYAVAMSGGVDSSLAAAILLQKHKVFGITLRMWDGHNVHGDSSCARDHAKDAALVCEHLGIEHVLVDVRKEFNDQVVEPFVQSYKNGYVPNPCVNCNAYMKWGAFVQAAREQGASRFATGHYANLTTVVLQGEEYTLLVRAQDKNKDQSYFLWKVAKEVLYHTDFPLATIDKEEVRQLATTIHLPVAKKKDSQDICFIPDGNKDDFLRSRLDGATDLNPGVICTWDGKPVGRHNGLAYYTPGQRKGLGVALGEPAFVLHKDYETNTLVVGPRDMLMETEFWVIDCNWFVKKQVVQKIYEEGELFVQLRYRSQEHQCAFIGAVPEQGEGGALKLFEPFNGIVPGQSAVFYYKDMVLGGATIALPV
jgi:tRNA-uridine 2-sulfurtransferase